MKEQRQIAIPLIASAYSFSSCEKAFINARSSGKELSVSMQESINLIHEISEVKTEIIHVNRSFTRIKKGTNKTPKKKKRR